MDNLLMLLALSCLCGLFWQQRRQSEIANSAVRRKCKELDLQVLSVSLGSHRLRDANGRWGWHTIYEFEFSALGDDAYHAKLVMKGFRVLNFHLPPHRI
ncbi:DUF3301 domain-containing protein [Vibrio hippocampi]|uniref:DUF3301 domain-containing protein n=1 Tax=Vibrio hippocampi TaxID=654686 RepID=A0ABN8DJD3_9VIBR|nr:DUF3301 domain-containing protein [Vibrio hippocampi]CAH0526697.1 hypothetical protein VHP8226_02069 [Vibrio hippocampi]